MYLARIFNKFSTSTSNSSELLNRLMVNSLTQVSKYGWTEKAIHAACIDLDLSPASHKLITPYQMISHCMTKWNEQALKVVDQSNFGDEKKIRKKIAFSIRTRLSKQLQFLDTWHQAMAIGAHPSNFLQTKDLLWRYSDQIWHRCGDRSLDYNHYTKRILFNTAYASTEIFLLTDQSTNKTASWEFLQRRLDNIEVVGKGINDLKTVATAATNGLLSFITMFQEPIKYDHPIPTQNTKDSQNQQSPKPQEPYDNTKNQEEMVGKTNQEEINQKAETQTRQNTSLNYAETKNQEEMVGKNAEETNLKNTNASSYAETKNEEEMVGKTNEEEVNLQKRNQRKSMAYIETKNQEEMMQKEGKK